MKKMKMNKQMGPSSSPSSPMYPTMRRQSAIFGMALFFAAGLLLGTVVSDFSHTDPATVTQQKSGEQSTQRSISQENTSGFEREIGAREQAVSADPKNQNAWIALGNAYFDAGKSAEAITAYERALTLGPASADLLTDLGIMYRQLHRFEDAVFAFRQAEAVDPTHLQSRLNEGIVLFYDLGQKDEAIRAWEEALALKPDIRLSNGEGLSVLLQQLKTTQK